MYIYIYIYIAVGTLVQHYKQYADFGTCSIQALLCLLALGALRRLAALRKELVAPRQRPFSVSLETSPKKGVWELGCRVSGFRAHGL